MEIVSKKNICILLFLFFVRAVSADNVVLKNGTLHSEVRTFLGSNSVYIVFKDGSVQVVAKSEVQSLMRAEVKWKEEEKTPVKPIAENPVTPSVGPPSAQDMGLRSQWSLVWRSALLPGWGQIHAGRTATGIAGIGAFALAGIYALSQRQNMLAAKAEYQDNVSTYFAIGAALQPSLSFNFAYVNAAVNGAAFAQYDRASKSYSNGAMLFALVYAMQAAHAYIVGVDWVNETSPTAMGPRRHGEHGEEDGGKFSVGFNQSRVAGSEVSAVYEVGF